MEYSFIFMNKGLKKAEIIFTMNSKVMFFKSSIITLHRCDIK